MSQTRRHVKNPLKTLRLWTCTTYCLMVIHPCAKYGKPMSNHNKIMGLTRICTDRRTDGGTERWTDVQTEWFLYTPWSLFTDGIITIVSINCWRKFDFRKMTINEKEMENVEKKWMRNGDMTISFLLRDALYNQDYNTCTSEALFTWVSPGMCRLLNGSELSETSQCSLVSTNK